ncbi:hypothetical protein BO78DRAFT_322664 [Aspergillus sclerotiicarbonarius CBS 121057]|uniref:Uncharacterized protein n=1 Tax=Aspergillus sclerotiicarbonarius (strain CBS 121057 / IBT 28362) TaxID=1448318 RepID=A0A319E9X8_ASPSB|nr:hypothetical protein BO78DRAFT_322664 [Aspergillus sclerotiicarbonarius CBS 121057]
MTTPKTHDLDPPPTSLPPPNLLTTIPYTTPTLIRHFYYSKTTNPYLLITNVPETIITESLDLDRFLQTKARISWNRTTRTLILKSGARRQEIACGHFNNEVHFFLHKTGLSHDLDPLGRATVVFDDEVVKDPDSSFCPRVLPPGRSCKWPSVVMHSGWVDGLGYLRGEAGLWLRRSGGDVRVVVLIALGDEEAVLEKWVPGEGLVQRVSIAKREGGDGAVVMGGPLTLTFQELFLRDPDPEKPGERDLVLDGDILRGVARLIGISE